MTESFTIGNLSLDNPTVLAPMAGVTDMPFRNLVKQNGCALVCSEMVSANGLAYGQKRTFDYLYTTGTEKPLSVQIFGKDPEIMARGAEIVEANGADIVDINFGCSVRKIIKNGYGAALMKDLRASEALLKAVRRAIRIPLTIKIRSGWDNPGEDAVALAKIAESCGVDAVCIHPRTARQLFRGKADWSVIKAVKKNISLPVIGNGDILTAGDALRMIEETGCDAVMVGRAAVSNPWIFREIRHLLGGRPLPEILPADRKEAVCGYVNDAMECYGEERASRMMRSRLGWMVKGLPNATRFRDRIKKIETRLDAIAMTEEYFGHLAETNPAKDPHPTLLC